MRRWVLAFLMAVTANWVSLIYAFGPVSWLLTTILLLGEFLYFNLRPIEKSGAPTKRIWYLKSVVSLNISRFIGIRIKRKWMNVYAGSSVKWEWKKNP